MDDNTLVFFSSDNGPWIVYGNHAGKTPFREAKGTGFDGGTRSACIMRYPGKIKAGSISERALVHGRYASHHGPAGRRDAAGESDRRQECVGPDHAESRARRIRTTIIRSPPGPDFEGVISGDGHWKLHLPHNLSARWSTPATTASRASTLRKHIELSLFDMEKDPFETNNVIERIPDIAARLEGYAERAPAGLLPRPGCHTVTEGEFAAGTTACIPRLCVQHYTSGTLRIARSKSVQRSSTASMPTLSRSSAGGRCSCPGMLARRSMVDSTAPRLVACWISCSLAQTASAARASPRTSNEIIVPKPLSWRRAASWVGWLVKPG